MESVQSFASKTVSRPRHGVRIGIRRAPRAQRGVALVIALVLLIVITLVGFAGVRGTIMQQKMATNLYDREVAFQNAEAAMRAAVTMLPSNPGLVSRNCQAGGTVCYPNPFEDPAFQASWVNSVPSGQYTAGTTATGQPQFVVENMGNWNDPTTDTGFGQTANAHNYGAQGKSTTSIYYRVTARSGDPDQVGDRAVVTLQAMIKQG